MGGGDLFGVGMGIRLNIEFLKDSGIEIERGVLVNEYLETNVPGVYAAGDVAEFNDLILGTTHSYRTHRKRSVPGTRWPGEIWLGRQKFSQITAYDTEVFGTMLMFVGACDLGTEHVIRGKR